jgi:uncharacterized protein with PQ loop repeat
MELVGYLGMLCFAACGLPQLVKAIRSNSVADLSFWFVFLWFAGEAFMVAYVAVVAFQWPLILNYGSGLVIAGWLTILKLRELL